MVWYANQAAAEKACEDRRDLKFITCEVALGLSIGAERPNAEPSRDVELAVPSVWPGCLPWRQ